MALLEILTSLSEAPQQIPNDDNQSCFDADQCSSHIVKIQEMETHAIAAWPPDLQSETSKPDDVDDVFLYFSTLEGYLSVFFRNNVYSKCAHKLQQGR